MIVKTRKQGNSIMITVPAAFNVKKNTQYQPLIDDNGVISFVPLTGNIFEENADYDFKSAIKEMNLGDNEELAGHEDVWS